MKQSVLFCLCSLLVWNSAVVAQTPGRQAEKKPPAYAAVVPEPSLKGIRYGTHRRHVLDLWKAESDHAVPLVFVIHGGGWVGGSKERVDRFADVAELLKAGISVAAINYRYTSHAAADGIEPPVKAPYTTPPEPCSSAGVRRKNGMLTLIGLGPPVVRPARVRVCGSHFMVISQNRKVKTRLPESRRGFGVLL